jgi:hypothetical protein
MHTPEDIAIFRAIQYRLHNGHSRVCSYIAADRRDYANQFDYIGRVGVKATAVKLVKNAIFMATQSTAIKGYVPHWLDSHDGVKRSGMVAPAIY